MYRSIILVIFLAGCGQAFKGQNLFYGDVDRFNVNGLNVLLNSDTSARFISVCLYITGGAAEIPKSITVALEPIMFQSMVRDGPQNTTRSYYRRLMQSHNFPIKTATTKSFSYIGFTSLRASFDTLWKYYSDCISLPDFDTTTLRTLKQRAITDISATQNTPERYARYLAEALFFVDHPYGRFATAQGVKSISLADLSDMHTYMMLKSRMLLVVSGSISKQELIDHIKSSAINNIPDIAGYTPHVIPRGQYATEPLIAFVQFERELPTTFVLGIFEGPKPGTADYYSFKLLTKIFQSEMFRYLRLKTSLSYAPRVEFLEGNPSYCLVEFETMNVREAMIAMNMILHKPKQKVFFGRTEPIYSSSRSYAYLKQQSTWTRVIELGEAVILTGTWRNAFASYYPDRMYYKEREFLDLLKTARKYVHNVSWIALGDTTRLERGWFWSH